jgi:hypothetical protein
VNQYGPNADAGHQYYILYYCRFKGIVDHGVAAVFDYDGFSLKALNIRQGVNQQLRPKIVIHCGFHGALL